MMRVLDLAKIRELSWKLENSLVGVKEAEFKEVNALLREDLSHPNKVSIRAPMLLDDFLKVLWEVVFRASDNSEVRGSSLGKPDGQFQFFEFFMVGRVLHLP